MKDRLLAYYLPQYHTIPENDEWWGKGFTEWTNVRKAKPLFPGHYQPKIPAELGYYTLLNSEIRMAQAKLAREYGIEGFVYWHYWFGNGKRLLERPFEEVLASGQPDFPFALAWANESWRGFAHGLSNERKVLIEQLYPGEEDYINHFNAVLPALRDRRYIQVEGKPIFLIYKPFAFDDVSRFIVLWRKLAEENALPGIYFIACVYDAEQKDELKEMGFDGINVSRLFEFYHHRKPFFQALKAKYYKLVFGCPNIVYYNDARKYFIGDDERKENIFPTTCSNWDHSPRTGRKGIIMLGSNPESFREDLKKAKDTVKDKDHDHSLIFIKSWNEWGEGNYLEPDRKYGRGFLEAIKDVFKPL